LDENIITIITFLLGGGVFTGAIALIDFIKKSKMLKKDLKAADLDNKNKELEIAEQMEGMATRAIERAMGTQERLDKLEADYLELKSNYLGLKDKVEKQDIIIAEQVEIIEELTCDLENNKLYNSALIKQMQDAEIIPIGIETLPIKDYNKKSRSKKKVDNY
jgi:hypothetical protein